MSLLWFVVLIVVLTLVYVRRAGVNPETVHRAVEADCDGDGPGHCLRVVAGDAETLARADAAMQALPRTQAVAGSVAEGRVTFVTRSKWIGFPDYTTIEHTDGQLRMFARLRFGKSDFGVNRARLEHVLRKVAL